MKIIVKLNAILEKTLPVMLIKKVLQVRWVFVTALLVLGSAVAVVFVSHNVRNQTALLEHLKHEQYQLEMEWEALRLEQGTLAEHNRIEHLARKNLAMKNVGVNDEVLIESQ